MVGDSLMPIQRGETCFVNLNPVQGREQASSRQSKTRRIVETSLGHLKPKGQGYRFHG
jgi:hypothetical protein